MQREREKEMEKRVNSKIENEEREGVRERCEKNNSCRYY